MRRRALLLPPLVLLTFLLYVWRRESWPSTRLLRPGPLPPASASTLPSSGHSPTPQPPDQNQNNGTADHGLPPGTRPPDSAPKDVAAFWAIWGQAMYDARPPPGPIRLASNALTVPPPRNPAASRTPYRDLVRNDADEIAAMTEAHQRFVARLRLLDSAEASAVFDGGRGVVLVGGGEYFGPAIISLHMLRRTGSTLPAEVFVPNEDEYEPDLCDYYLPRLNARCVVLSRILAHGGPGAAKLDITHYQLKAVAALLSSFAEVLLLDSDSIPLFDPESELFGKAPYSTKGLLLWPDYWVATESPKFWQIAGLETYPENLPITSSESGQLVLNKKKHLATLLLATYYNVFGQDQYYPLLSQGALGQGDKETFLAAAVVLGAPYYRVLSPPQALGRHDGNQFKGTAMVQHLPWDDMAKAGEGDVRPVTLHANTPKMNAGHLVDEGDLLSKGTSPGRLRLLGTKEEQVKLFGLDIESTIWDLLLQTGCELADVIREWKDRDRLCDRLRQHHDQLFGKDE